MELTEKSRLLDLLEVGNSVMADKGFTIGELLAQRGITLNIPPFMQNGKLLEGDTKLTCSIATLRIHMERAIVEQVKNFRIIDAFQIVYQLLQLVTSFFCLSSANQYAISSC